ncbi:MAG: hypothetical protein C4337_01765 [Armatimonadota bacterium]
MLLETLRQHAECFNAVAAYGWAQREKNGVRLHHATYRTLREKFPNLPAQLGIKVCSIKPLASTART